MRAPRQEAGEASYAAQRRKDAAQEHDHPRRRLDAVGWPHKHIERAEASLFKTKRLADAALDPVALARPRGMLAGHQQPEARAARVAAFQVEGITGHFFLPAIAQQAFELRFLREAPACAEPEAFLARGYSPSRRRPRARRLRSTARPPRVPLRTRKPWRRARRVLEGW